MKKLGGAIAALGMALVLATPTAHAAPAEKPKSSAIVKDSHSDAYIKSKRYSGLELYSVRYSLTAEAFVADVKFRNLTRKNVKFLGKHGREIVQVNIEQPNGVKRYVATGPESGLYVATYFEGFGYDELTCDDGSWLANYQRDVIRFKAPYECIAFSDGTDVDAQTVMQKVRAYAVVRSIASFSAPGTNIGDVTRTGRRIERP